MIDSAPENRYNWAMEALLIVIILVLVGVVAFLLFKRDSYGDNQSLLLLRDDIKELTKSLSERLKDQGDSHDKVIGDIRDKFLNFTAGITSMDERLKQVGSSIKEVSTFQQIFRTPKLRGRWGELALEHILSEYYGKDLFITQYPFKSGEVVDAVLKLPNGKLLPIDAKFPYENFERMVELENDGEKGVAKKLFATDVKKEIDDIARKYILPSEGTVNVACMYVPAEAVYFEINNSLPEIVNYARSKRVFLSSPNTIHLMLQVFEHWARDLQISRQTQEIIKRMSRVITDAQKLNTSFNKLGKHLSDARSSYEDSDKRLVLLVERTEKLVELEGGEEAGIEPTPLEKPNHENEE